VIWTTGASKFIAGGLTDPVPGNTMDPVNSMKLDAKVNCVSRMNGTSWWHPSRAHGKREISMKNVPISEQAGTTHG